MSLATFKQTAHTAVHYFMQMFLGHAEDNGSANIIHYNRGKIQTWIEQVKQVKTIKQINLAGSDIVKFVLP